MNVELLACVRACISFFCPYTGLSSARGGGSSAMQNEEDSFCVDLGVAADRRVCGLRGKMRAGGYGVRLEGFPCRVDCHKEGR